MYNEIQILTCRRYGGPCVYRQTVGDPGMLAHKVITYYLLKAGSGHAF